MRLIATLLFAGLAWGQSGDRRNQVTMPSPMADKVSLTDGEKLAIRTLQLRLARVEAAKAQIAAEEKSATEALSKIVQAQAAKGCALKDDLTCEVKPEVKKEK